MLAPPLEHQNESTGNVPSEEIDRDGLVARLSSLTSLAAKRVGERRREHAAQTLVDRGGAARVHREPIVVAPPLDVLEKGRLNRSSRSVESAHRDGGGG